MAEQRRVRVVVSGRVQGVWFRESTRQTAEAVGATGWVRNCRDGSVEAEIQGTGEAVGEVVAFARGGPAAAAVGDVSVEDLEPVDAERGFEVR